MPMDGRPSDPIRESEEGRTPGILKRCFVCNTSATATSCGSKHILSDSSEDKTWWYPTSSSGMMLHTAKPDTRTSHRWLSLAFRNHPWNSQSRAKAWAWALSLIPGDGEKSIKDFLTDERMVQALFLSDEMSLINTWQYEFFVLGLWQVSWDDRDRCRSQNFEILTPKSKNLVPDYLWCMEVETTTAELGSFSSGTTWIHVLRQQLFHCPQVSQSLFLPWSELTSAPACGLYSARLLPYLVQID